MTSVAHWPNCRSSSAAPSSSPTRGIHLPRGRRAHRSVARDRDGRLRLALAKLRDSLSGTTAAPLAAFDTTIPGEAQR